MTVADVKVQTLKLMGLNSEDISPAILPDLYADENYTDIFPRCRRLLRGH